MKTSFQDGVDAIYNAIVAQGTTPGGKSPADLVSSISTMANNKYEAGKENELNFSSDKIGVYGDVYTRPTTPTSNIKTENVTITVNSGCKYVFGLLIKSCGGSISPVSGCTSVWASSIGDPYSFSQFHIMKVVNNSRTLTFSVNTHSNGGNNPKLSFLALY